MPRSNALWTTLRVAARSILPPKLLQPRPTTETRRPDFPRFLCSIRSSGLKRGKDFVECGQLVAVERVVGDPAVGQVFWNVIASIFGEGLLDRRHLRAVAGFLPVIAVVRQ